MTGKLNTLPAMMALALLAGCASTGEKPEKPEKTVALTPTEQFVSAVKVTSRPDSVSLAPHASGLSSTQGEALDALVARWRDADGAEILIQTAGDGGQLVAAQSRVYLLARGIPSDGIRTGDYDAAGKANPPVMVSFTRYEAETPKCGQVWNNLSATGANTPFPNFGCAVTANMAAQVADPRDILRPRTTTPADAARRSVVLGKYRAGEVTSSAKDDQAKGTVSQAVD